MVDIIIDFTEEDVIALAMLAVASYSVLKMASDVLVAKAAIERHLRKVATVFAEHMAVLN